MSEHLFAPMPGAGPNRHGQMLSRRSALGLGVAMAATACTGRSTSSPTGATAATPSTAQTSDESAAPPSFSDTAPSSHVTTPVTRPELPRPPLASTVVSMWMNTFEHPTVAELPADVLKHTTQLIFAMAQSAQAGTGLLRWAPTVQAPQEVADDIATYVQGGKPVLLGIGGSDDGGITLTNAQQVEEFCTSVQALVQEYGFTGVDLDLEPSGGSWNVASVHAVTTQLKALYGKTFLIGLTVGLYAEFTARWLSLAKVLGTSFDYWSPMLYDFPEAHDDQLIAVAHAKVELAISGGVPAAKQVLGFMCNSYYNSSTIDVTQRTVKSVAKKYRTIRGAYIWESKLERASNYEWTRTVGRMLATND